MPQTENAPDLDSIRRASERLRRSISTRDRPLLSSRPLYAITGGSCAHKGGELSRQVRGVHDPRGVTGDCGSSTRRGKSGEARSSTHSLGQPAQDSPGRGESLGVGPVLASLMKGPAPAIKAGRPKRGYARRVSLRANARRREETVFDRLLIAGGGRGFHGSSSVRQLHVHRGQARLLGSADPAGPLDVQWSYADGSGGAGGLLAGYFTGSALGSFKGASPSTPGRSSAVEARAGRRHARRVGSITVRDGCASDGPENTVADGPPGTSSAPALSP